MAQAGERDHGVGVAGVGDKAFNELGLSEVAGGQREAGAGEGEEGEGHVLVVGGGGVGVRGVEIRDLEAGMSGGRC